MDLAKLTRADMLLTLHPNLNSLPHNLNYIKVKYPLYEKKKILRRQK